MVRPHLSPAPGVCRIVLTYQTPDGLQLNTFHFHKDTDYSLADLQSCASAIINWESVEGFLSRSSLVSLIKVELIDLSSPTGNYYATSPDPFIYGRLDTDYLPGNVTLAVCFTTGKRGTGRQGRIFWIGLTASMLEGLKIAPGYGHQILAAIGQLQFTFADARLGDLGVVHRTLDGVALHPATFEPMVSAVLTDLTTDSQINRLPGRSRPSHRP